MTSGPAQPAPEAKSSLAAQCAAADPQTHHLCSPGEPKGGVSLCHCGQRPASRISIRPYTVLPSVCPRSVAHQHTCWTRGQAMRGQPGQKGFGGPELIWRAPGWGQRAMERVRASEHPHGRAGRNVRASAKRRRPGTPVGQECFFDGGAGALPPSSPPRAPLVFRERLLACRNGAPS